jgi:16S rRNA (adenine1518-N6/adenine1519-N6)-dimethyltransferase
LWLNGRKTEKRMKQVRPKKFLGQHFLKDKNIASNIVDALSGFTGYKTVLEVGPGMGVLTEFLVKKNQFDVHVIEIDRESVAYLREHFLLPQDRIIEGDFLELDLGKLFSERFAVIGNFPYNISSQIFFKILDHYDSIPEVVGMIQKEVAERIAAKHGNKTYGILSVLLQAFYDIEYLFTVHEHVFKPEPKVKSAVIRLKRNQRSKLPCDEVMFKTVVKQGFQNRRKTLRNALKRLNLPAAVIQNEILDKRAEQLSVEDFFHLTNLIQQNEG